MKILFAAIGSYGDINPYLALSKELLQRGHSPMIATASAYRRPIEEAGVGFSPLRPEAEVDDVPLIRRVVDARHGSEAVVRELVMPALRDMYADLEGPAASADLLVSHVLTYAVPILAEKTGKPWLSTVLSPLVFFSPYDVPVLPQAPWLAGAMRPLGPAINRCLLSLGKKVSYSWSAPARVLRKDLGLPPGKDPLWEGQHSPHGVLALFSRHFAGPQPDWPRNTTVCGFPFLDNETNPLDPELAEFLKEGEPPLVFTLGSAAVMIAGDFYEHAIRAAVELKRRAILVAGPKTEELAKRLPSTMKAVRWAAFPALFKKAAAVIHSGGVGTTAQALRGGKPQLVVPFAHDQFDNADRVRRLGAGGLLHRSRVNTPRLVKTLELLLNNPGIQDEAKRIGQLVGNENGAAAACDRIETTLKNNLR